MKISHFILITALLLLIPKAHCAFLVEPYFGHTAGKYKENSNRGDADGFVHGFRLGYIGTLFISGLDISLQYPEFSSSFLSEGEEKTYRTANVGLFLGAITPNYKITFAYMASSLQKKNGNPQKRIYFADTLKYTVGVRLFWRVFFNVEYLHSVYDEYEENRDLTYGITPYSTDSLQGTLSVVWSIL
ncbi:MAG: hypothetical protein JNM93_03115 [Bacteriovoracaceae bacterium]|nr:hypothetical protein [Bacteriovoracaceae bacterium]